MWLLGHIYSIWNNILISVWECASDIYYSDDANTTKRYINKLYFETDESTPAACPNKLHIIVLHE
jgi:hypothetical protein